MTTRAQLIAWHSRWAEVNDATERDRRPSSPAERLANLDQLLALASSVTLTTWPDDEEPVVWARFQQLRSLHRARLERR